MFHVKKPTVTRTDKFEIWLPQIPEISTTNYLTDSAKYDWPYIIESSSAIHKNTMPLRAIDRATYPLIPVGMVILGNQNLVPFGDEISELPTRVGTPKCAVGRAARAN